MKKQSLEYIVKTYFPLIEDKFNFRLGTVKGVSFNYSATDYSPVINIYFPFSPTKKTLTYKSKEEALEKYRKIVTEYFSEYVSNNHFELLYNELISAIIIKIKKTLEKRKSDIDKLCEFTHARFKILDKNEYTRLFKGSNELCRISYISADIAKRKPRYVSIKHNEITIAVTKANISLIMEDIETNLIINDNQRKMIIEQLNFLIGPTDGYDVCTENIYNYSNIINQIELKMLQQIRINSGWDDINDISELGDDWMHFVDPTLSKLYKQLKEHKNA